MGFYRGFTVGFGTVYIGLQRKRLCKSCIRLYGSIFGRFFVIELLSISARDFWEPSSAKATKSGPNSRSIQDSFDPGRRSGWEFLGVWDLGFTV